MGVDHTAVFGFGVQLTGAECVTALANLLSIEEDEVEEKFDEPYDVLASKFEFGFQSLGNSYSGDIWYLIGPEHTEVLDLEGGEASIKIDAAGLSRFKVMLEKIKCDKIPGAVIGWVTDEVHTW